MRGLDHIVLAVHDLDHCKASFEQLGFTTTPDAVFFVCQQHFPEHFWKPQYQQHPNAAKSLQCVWMQAQEPGRFRDFLLSLFPEGRITEQAEGITLELDYGQLALRTPRFFSERFAGLTLPPASNGPRFTAVTVAAGEAAAPVSVHGLIVERTTH